MFSSKFNILYNILGKLFTLGIKYANIITLKSNKAMLKILKVKENGDNYEKINFKNNCVCFNGSNDAVLLLWFK